MNYLELVQKSMYRCGLRSGNPSTLADAIDITLDFKNWVQDSWRELQEETVDWWFRQKLDQTLSIVAGDDQYAMPTGLETINYRTCTLYTTEKIDESNMFKQKYEDWRMERDTVSSAEGRPNTIVETPEGTIQVWPVPDQAYTLRFDGVWDIDEMLLDTDTPGSNVTGSTSLPERYHWVLIYDTMRRYAEHHEDPQGVEKAQTKFLAQHARLTEKQRPPIYVPPGILTGMGRGYRRLR